MRNKILVYDDDGTADTGDLKRCLRAYFEPLKIETASVRGEDVLYKDALNDEILAFFLPGGAATPYMQKLKTLGNQKIRDYVSAGGIYFGICAGAYYAAEKISFENDVPELALEQHCGLDLIKARAVGTLKKDFGLAPYGKPTPANAAVVKVIWREDAGEHGVFYHGGPKFEDVRDAEVLAVYKDAAGQPPAILQRSYGKGLVIVSGVHFEDDALSLEALVRHHKTLEKRAKGIRSEIIKCEASRQSLTDKLMAKLVNRR